MLSQKLTRTRKTLSNLTVAKEDYQNTAKKVQEYEEKLGEQPSQSHDAKNAPCNSKNNAKRLSSAEATSLRQELDRATSMMNAACHRVGQIEAITDALVKQLADAEAELAEVQQMRQEESSVHADQVHRLTTERASLALTLETAEKKIKDLEKQEEKLNAKLAVAMAENNKKLKKERNSLASSLKDLRTKQRELAADLKAKEEQLAEAMERANTGTPVGQGAKTVLPMALRRIKATQEALKAEEESKAEAEAELARLSVESAAREAALKLKLEEVEGERLRQVAEKQASLESMTRAVAAATKEAAVKQETVNKLVAEVSTLDKAREDLQEELQNASARSMELEAKLASVHMELAAAAQEKEFVAAAVAELSVQAEQATTARDELSKALHSTKATARALEQSIVDMKKVVDTSTAAHKEELSRLELGTEEAVARAQDLEGKLSQAVAAQTAALNECSELKGRLQQQEASLVDLTAAVAAARARAAEADEKVMEAQEAAGSQKGRLLKALEEMENELSFALSRRDQLEQELVNAKEMCKAMEGSVVDLRSQLLVLKESLLVKEDRMKAMVEENTVRLEAVLAQAVHAAQAQESMESSVAHLRKKVAELTESNSELRSESIDTVAKMSDIKENMGKHLEAAVQAQNKMIADRSVLEQRIEEQQNAINHVSHVLKDRNNHVAELESRLQYVQKSMQDKLGEAMQAQADLMDQRTKLQERVLYQEGTISNITESLCSRSMQLDDLKASMAAAQNALHVQLSTAADAQSRLIDQQTKLEQRLREQNESIGHMTEAIASKNHQIVELESLMEDARSRAASHAASLCAQLELAVSERDCINDRLSILSTGMSEIAAALDAAVPSGEENSSCVIDAAFAKIQRLHDALEGARQQVHSKAAIIAERDASIAELQEAGRQREELAAALQGRLTAAVDAAEVRSAVLEKELDAEREMMRELERVNGEIAPHVEKLTVELEHSMASHNEFITRSEQALKEAAAKIDQAVAERDVLAKNKAALEAEVAALAEQLDAVKADTRDKTEGSNKVRQLSFQKIKALEAAVAEKSAVICELEIKLDCLEDISAQLEANIVAKEKAMNDAQSELKEKVHALKSDNAALESSVCRLRVDVLAEFEKRQEAETRAADAKGQLLLLETTVDGLHKQVAASQAEARAFKAGREADAIVATEEMGVVKSALAVARTKLETTEAQLDALRKRSADREAAGTEVSRVAFERIDSLERALEETTEQRSRAEKAVARLELDLSSAEACLEVSFANVARIESDFKLKMEEAAALAEQVERSGCMLIEADLNAKHLVAKHHEELAGLHVKMDDLHARAVAAEEELAVARRAAVVDEETLADARTEVASLRERVAHLMFKYAAAAAEAKINAEALDALQKSCSQEDAACEALAEIAALRAEHAMLTHKYASLAADILKKDDALAHQTDQLQLLSEELEAQKSAMTTNKRLAAIREAELTRSLRATDDLIATLRQQHAVELEESKKKIKSLREANASLENEARTAMLFSCTHAEICAQLDQARVDRKSAGARAEHAVKENSRLVSHKVELEKKVEEAEKREESLRRRLRSGRAWTLVVAGAAAVFWAAHHSKGQ